MDNNRIRSGEFLNQRISFDGMLYTVRGKRIVPITDIDALMDVMGKAWIIYECKHGNAMPPKGQRIALENLARDIERRGKPVAVFVASHNAPKGEEVYLKDCIITQIFVNGKWIDAFKVYQRECTAKELTDEFLQRYCPEML